MRRSHDSLGQVFTPRRVADWMVSWACVDRPRRVLEPAAGAGVFIEALDAWHRRERPDHRIQVDAWELDGKLARGLPVDLAGVDLKVRATDFVRARRVGAYDAAVANPPYVRHHAFDYADGVWQRFDRQCGERLSRMTNLYGLFLLRIAALLRPGGRAAIITPAEWLNADFGVPIKRHLLRTHVLDGIVLFGEKVAVFDGRLTTAAIALLRPGRRADEAIRCVTVDRLDDLVGVGVSMADGRGFCAEALPAEAKWLGLLRAPQASSGEGARTVGDVARCHRGIATGANQYFTLSEQDRRRWGLDLADVRCCVTKAQYVCGDVFGEDDLSRLIEVGRRVYLLHPRRPLSPAVKRYLAAGRRLGIPERYLPAHRPVWYLPERRAPAPIWVPVFSREGFRFVRNDAEALNLTAFHGLYPRAGCGLTPRALVALLNGDAVQSALRWHHRTYADGLYKLEPRDVERLPLPDLVATDPCHDGEYAGKQSARSKRRSNTVLGRGP